MLIITYFGGSKSKDVEIHHKPMGKAQYLYTTQGECYQRLETIYARDRDVCFLVYALKDSDAQDRDASPVAGNTGTGT